ncbi:hypothetical protein DSW25_12945 [Sulfitobacter donghicola DSW-25 = KCTC 12864 = JCM 14565]|uniref:Uncharacterized protein n=1 Tax=Sulfitobacter donghicola DSW-25 = KCTC 12864 = JCM 14565 TaxID=1300350 RepID=A0A073IUV4_9RHOB|nr:hypothetical protein DSW25_12945 [Sulfitobacter donghicola DSW-25 = KCTC 12864 = JCM 14565]
MVNRGRFARVFFALLRGIAEGQERITIPVGHRDKNYPIPRLAGMREGCDRPWPDSVPCSAIFAGWAAGGAIWAEMYFGKT